jgi:glutamyl-tRNA reductase
VIVDIAVPRDVDPEAAGVAGVDLYNLDDLQRAAERGLEDRRTALPEAERRVQEELGRTAAMLEARAAAPVARALVRRVEALRDEELARALEHEKGGDPRLRDALAELADALTRKFLHGPLRHLRETADPRLDGAVLGEAFDLAPEDRLDR